MRVAIYRLLVFVLVGSGLVTCLWWGPSIVWRASASTDWPVVAGEVISSEAVLHRSGGSSSSRWRAEIRYRYDVDGAEYVGDDVWVLGADMMRPKKEVRAIVAASPVGGSVDVHVDPADPETACLVPGGAWRGWANIGFGVVLTSLGLYFMWSRARTRERRLG